LTGGLTKRYPYFYRLQFIYITWSYSSCHYTKQLKYHTQPNREMHSAVSSSSRMGSHTVSDADLDVLSLLTSDESSMGPLPTQPKPHKAKRLPRRESPMDALLISAVLSGSGPLTRHHIGHGAGQCIDPVTRHETDNQLDLVLMLRAMRIDRHPLQEGRAILQRYQ
jgi:hypothetical protein